VAAGLSEDARRAAPRGAEPREEGLTLKRLYLLRHAKSSWKDPELADHDRPLNGRGVRAAKAMARHLRDEGIDPELIVCSSARRARDTLKGIEPALARRRVEVEPMVYGASGGTLLELVRAIPDDVDAAMVIGHNPGLEELALQLARYEGPLVHELEAKYPTGALATLAFDGPRWAGLAAHHAELTGFVRPRDLKG
jgi:phosphohistidine phosphatase